MAPELLHYLRGLPLENIWSRDETFCRIWGPGARPFQTLHMKCPG